MYRVSGFKTEFHKHLNGLWEAHELGEAHGYEKSGICRAFLFFARREWRFTNQHYACPRPALIFAYKREKELQIGVPTEWLGLDAAGVPWPVSVTIKAVPEKTDG